MASGPGRSALFCGGSSQQPPSSLRKFTPQIAVDAKNCTIIGPVICFSPVALVQEHCGVTCALVLRNDLERAVRIRRIGPNASVHPEVVAIGAGRVRRGERARHATPVAA